MTKIPMMKVAMERSIAVIIDGQQSCGGFDYGYKKGERTDMSVSGWNFQALKAARVAGSTNPELPSAIRKAVVYCCSKGFTTNAFVYTDKGSTGSNMQGVGTVSLQLLGGYKRIQCKTGIKNIAYHRLEKYREIYNRPSKWREVGGECLYGFYYDTQAVFNNMNESGGKKLWKEWRAVFEKVLIRAQTAEGYWETNGKHKIGSSDIPGRVLSTCLAGLQLMVYYRYLPSFDINKMNAVSDIDDENIGNIGNGEGLVIEID